MTGLPVGDVINVGVSLSPQAAQERNFGVPLILGDSDVIDTYERYRPYTSSDSVAEDFGGSAPEYLAAKDFFAQDPQPQLCYVGRWASTNTHGLLRGAVLAASQQSIANFTSIANGSLSISVDGTPHALTNINLSAVGNLNAVAAAIQAAMSGIATVIWDDNNSRFIIESLSSGSISAVAFATAPGSGTDLAPLLAIRAQDGGYSVAGIVAETLLAGVTLLANKTSDWYGLVVAANAAPADGDINLVAGFIESANPARIFEATTQEPQTLDPTVTSDLASILVAGGYNRTSCNYSSSDPYMGASPIGRLATVDYTGDDTTITLDFKQMPGIAPELISEPQRQALRGKFCNAYLKYNNDTSIYQEGWMASGQFIDAVVGTDWLQNFVQTAIWNLYLLTSTKLPQTEQGLNRILTVISQSLQQGVNNGLLYAGGTWTGPPIGSVLATGQVLPKGYLVFADSLASQSAADRGARKTPLIQAPCKLAGAFHSANVLLSFNA